jgi:hypothetical protein
MVARRIFILSFVLAATALMLAHAAVRMRVQTVTLAGVGYHQGSDVWSLLHEGDALTLVREADNKHDPLAVRVDWQGHVLGYIPRDQSGPIATAMDRGTRLSARIAQLREHPNPRERILIEVFAELGTQ